MNHLQPKASLRKGPGAKPLEFEQQAVKIKDTSQAGQIVCIGWKHGPEINRSGSAVYLSHAINKAVKLWGQLLESQRPPS
jgi:hypothetical protein